MKIPFSICDDDLENPVIYTLSHSKKFYHLKLEDFIKHDRKKLLIVPDNIKDDLLNKLTKQLENSNCFFLITAKMQTKLTKQKLKTIIYPIQPNAIIENFSDDSQIVNNDFSLVLRKDGILFNLVNDMSVYLTETESSIIELLFSQGLAEKDLIREKILKLHKSVDTKSLESHLSRIRKKIKEIKSNVELVSTNSNQIRIKSTNQSSD
tara:strand:- start:1185 stop:1808 length:624 start_codon:yes stop_codon:yes gene_type:complete